MFPYFYFPALLPPDAAEESGDDAEDQGAEKGRPEAGNIEALNEGGNKPEEEGVDHQREEPQGQDVDGKGEQDQKGTDEGVDQSEQKGRDQSDVKGGDHDPGYDVGDGD